MINRLVFVVLVIASVYVSGLIAGEWLMFYDRHDLWVGTPFVISMIIMFFGPLAGMVATAKWVCFGKKGTQNA